MKSEKEMLMLYSKISLYHGSIQNWFVQAIFL